MRRRKKDYRGDNFNNNGKEAGEGRNRSRISTVKKVVFKKTKKEVGK